MGYFIINIIARNIYPELKKKDLDKEQSNEEWKVISTTKFALWIDTQSSTNKTLHGSRRTLEKSKVLLQIKKVAENSNYYSTCHVFSIGDALAHLATSDPSTKVLKSMLLSFTFYPILWLLASNKSFCCSFTCPFIFCRLHNYLRIIPHISHQQF